MLSFFKALSDWVDKLTFWLAAPIGVILVATVFGGVAGRMLEIPFITSVEVARLTFVWACFLGAALGWRREAHIKFTAAEGFLPPRGKLLLRIVLDIAALAFFVFLLDFGIALNKKMLLTFFPTLGISQVWMYGALPLTMVIMIIHTAYFILRDMSMTAEPQAAHAAQWSDE